MIQAIGLDITEISRIEQDLEKYGQKFIDRILSPAEQDILASRADQAQFLAGRFAAKEAVIKGLGRYLTDRPPYKQIEILRDESGRPQIRLPHGITRKLGAVECLISISHERNYAVAMALFQEEQ